MAMVLINLHSGIFICRVPPPHTVLCIVFAYSERLVVFALTIQHEFPVTFYANS